MQGKAGDAGGLTPAKDGNAAMRPLHPRAFARNSEDYYNNPVGVHIPDREPRLHGELAPLCRKGAPLFHEQF